MLLLLLFFFLFLINSTSSFETNKCVQEDSIFLLFARDLKMPDLSTRSCNQYSLLL